MRLKDEPGVDRTFWAEGMIKNEDAEVGSGQSQSLLCVYSTGGTRTAVAVQEGFLRILKHVTSLCRQCGVQRWGTAHDQRYTLGKLVWPRSKENQNSHQ